MSLLKEQKSDLSIIVKCGLSNDRVRVPATVVKKVPCFYDILIINSEVPDTATPPMSIMPDMDSVILNYIIQFYLLFPEGEYLSCLPETQTELYENLGSIAYRHDMSSLLLAMFEKEAQEEAFKRGQKSADEIRKGKTYLRSRVQRIGIVGATGETEDHFRKSFRATFPVQWLRVPRYPDIGERRSGAIPDCQHPLAVFSNEDVPFNQASMPDGFFELQLGDVVLYEMDIPKFKLRIPRDMPAYTKKRVACNIKLVRNLK